MFHFCVCVDDKNHIVENSSGDIILPKHLVNPTNHSLVRHLKRPASYFWPVTFFLFWFTIFCVGWTDMSLNVITPLIMAEINPRGSPQVKQKTMSPFLTIFFYFRASLNVNFNFLGLVRIWRRRAFGINIHTLKFEGWSILLVNAQDTLFSAASLGNPRHKNSLIQNTKLHFHT